ncbi:tetratricopeptide repeat protein [Nonomuraea cavernae]|uniref:tetratricopeptide repeat protein n=1 Tax=Nonomuraea cavernae TaxID=2045107 RepID=UPI0033F5E3FB
MTNTPRSLQDLVRRRQQAGFIGREVEIAFFRANLDLPLEDERRRVLFSIHGDGGMGKTFLLSRLRRIAQDAGRLTARVDESAYEVVEVMAAVAAELEGQGARLKRFTQQHAAYRRRRHETEAGDDVAGAVTRTATQVATGTVGALVPGASLLTGAIDPEQVNRLRVAAMDRLRGREPAPAPAQELTPAFLEGLRELPRPLALFFDTYERTGAYLDDWLRDVFEGRYGEAPVDLVVTVAGRLPLDPLRWSPYLSVLADLPLVPFTEVEVRRLLARRSVTDERVIEVISAVSGGLPLAVATLAEQRPSDPGAVADPSDGLVDRFLRWEADPVRRDLAVTAALPRRFDEDLVGVLVGVPGADAAGHYAWLRAQSFVTRSGGGCRYHDVVREPMLRLGRGRSPYRWQQAHHALAGAYHDRRERLGLAAEDAWADETWESCLLEEFYHLACADPAGSLPGLLETALGACAAGSAWARRWAEMIASAGADADSNRLAALGRDLGAGLGEDGDLTGFLGVLIGHRTFPADRLKEAYRVRGREHRYACRFDRALGDFEAALELDPGYQPAVGDRGETYRLMRRPEEALADLTRAVELDPRDAWAFGGRGQVLRVMARFDEAVADLTRAVELDPGYAWAFATRGEVHQRCGRHEEALADLTRAIELRPGYTWAAGTRAVTHRLMGRHAEAIIGLTLAITAKPDYAWGLSLRGDLQRILGRHDEALADHDRAVELEPDTPWALARRARALRRVGRHDEARADLARAVELAPHDDEHALELRLCGGPPPAGCVWVADLDATEGDGPSLASSLREWLVSGGVVAADTQVLSLDARPVHPRIPPPGGLSLHTGRIACHPMAAEGATCPGCGSRAVLSRDGVATDEWDEIAASIADWTAGRLPGHGCRACGRRGDLREWRFDPPWAFAHLAVRLWDWGPPAPEFLAALSERLGGHRLMVLPGRE